MPDKSKVLFLNIGTATKGEYHGKGDADYYASFRTAIDNAKCGNIVLISSDESKDKAEKLKGMYPEYEYYDISLKKGDEYETGECFKKIYDGLASLKEVMDINNDSIIDITHGTGPMKSGLLAAALYHGVSNIQYMKRKGRPGAWEGEEVLIVDSSYPRILSLLKQCKTLFKAWQFPAAQSLLDGMNGPIENVKILADFYSAWDRLDYKTAAQICSEPQNSSAFDEGLTFYKDISFGFAATDAVRNWIKDLAKSVIEPDEKKDTFLSKEQKDENAKIVLNIMFDLYANGLRRLDAGQYEDAAIRAYRIAEMMGQYYLFKKGYISDHMYLSDAVTRNFAENKRLNSRDSDILPPFGRKQVIEFLSYIKHEEAAFLKSLEADVERRNNSILIHGYASSIDDVENLKTVFNSLKTKLMSEAGEEEGKEKLATALFMNKFKDSK